MESGSGGGGQVRLGRSSIRAQRGLLALVAAALIVLAGPAGIAAAQCLADPAGHAAASAVAVHDHGGKEDAGHAHVGQAHTEHGRAMAGHDDSAMHDACLPALDCCDIHCLAAGSRAPAVLPLATPLPAAPLTPVAQLRAPPATAEDGSSVLPVPPWTRPTLELLTILRV
ncbi:hypothetical protein [Tomitella cavernea]|nr:hypothetical protein [Tomitella cavernea]